MGKGVMHAAAVERGSLGAAVYAFGWGIWREIVGFAGSAEFIY